MLRRLLLSVLVIAVFASLGSAGARPDAAQASPANQTATLFFTANISGDGSVDEQVEFSRDEHVIWAVLDYPYLSSGSRLSYILRLNGWDYKWGKLELGRASGGTIAFSLSNKDHKGKAIPGGAYLLLVYDGDTEIARGGFGVRGGRGSDNDNDH